MDQSLAGRNWRNLFSFRVIFGVIATLTAFTAILSALWLFAWFTGDQPIIVLAVIVGLVTYGFAQLERG